jgi:type I restriction enzyme S subunit
MALKVISINFQDLKKEIYRRMDAKYFIIHNLFDELSKTRGYNVKTIEELENNISSGSYIDTYISKDQGIRYLRVSDVKPFNINENDRNLVYVPANVPEKIKVKQGDIIVARTEATIEKLGVSSIIDNMLEGSAISQHLSKITVKPKIISPYYLLSYLNSKFFKIQMQTATQGDTRVELTHSQLRKIKVFIPPTEVSNQIDEDVRCIVQLGTKSTTLLEKAKDMLRKELNLPSHSLGESYYVSTSKKDISDFGAWDVNAFSPVYVGIEEYLKKKFKCKPLGTIITPHRGIEVGSENYKTYLSKLDTDYAFIRTSDIINNEVDIYPDYFISLDDINPKKAKLNAGDLIFSTDGKIAEVAVASKFDKAIASSGFRKLELQTNEEDITKEYLFTVLSLDETGFYPAIRRTVIASTIPHLREERLKEIPIPVIETEKINKISSLVLEAFKLKDQRKELMLKIINKIDNLFDL